MKYRDLSKVWQRIFELEWEAVQYGSKAIAAVIVDEQGEIISEGRNRIAEYTVPNALTAHAEVEAVRNLDIKRYPCPKKYTLYTGLEPCVMCMGTIVMGHIRQVVIAARDAYGGAMQLMDESAFIRHKHMKVTFLDNRLGDIQRGLQAIRELLFEEDKVRLERRLDDFSAYNQQGVQAARLLVSQGVVQKHGIKDITIHVLFDKMMAIMESPEDNH